MGATPYIVTVDSAAAISAVLTTPNVLSKWQDAAISETVNAKWQEIDVH